jgi:hypothetical protein
VGNAGSGAFIDQSAARESIEAEGRRVFIGSVAGEQMRQREPS